MPFRPGATLPTVLFVEPPRQIWPYVNYDDNYLTKQSYLVLAANLRHHRVARVEILDCMAQRIGWQSLAAELKRRRPDIVALGENHALHAHEALRCLQLARELLPQVVTVAGGAHFTHLADACLGGPASPRSAAAPPWFQPPPPGTIDFIVKGEGDMTLVELVRHLANSPGRAPRELPGLAFAEQGRVLHTPPRELVADLDSLPLPAYDLLPMHLYGRSRLLFSPGGTTISHSRGCAHSCDFCVWWTQNARRTVDPTSGEERLHPRWRTRSPERTVEEIELLARTFDKRGLVFVDDCFNLDPDWNLAFARLLQRKRLGVNWFAFMRADYLVRDHHNGILKELVKSGLAHVSIGAERAEDEELDRFGKRHYSAQTTRTAFALLRDHYPAVFRQATFIVGLPEETEESMLRQLAFARELQLDYPGFHPLTPVPGTPLWNRAIAAGTLEAGSFAEFDWSTPVQPSRHLSRRRIEELLIKLDRDFVTPRWLLKGLTSRHPYRRAMYQWFAKVSASMAFTLARHQLLPNQGPLVPMVKPPWYEK